MAGDREDGVIELTLDPGKLITPELFDRTRIDTTVAVRRSLDEHHGREVIHIPVGTDFNEIDLLAMHQWLHPFFGLFGEVDLGPAVARAGIHGNKVLVA